MTSSSKNWRIEVDPFVYKKLAKFPRRNADAVLEGISDIARNPYGGDIQKMKGEQNTWRRRIGRYRIFYEIDKKKEVLRVFHVERRTSTTYS